jgi:hypothetical protein
MKSFNLPATAPLQRGFLLCADYERQLGGGSPLSSLMAAKKTRLDGQEPDIDGRLAASRACRKGHQLARRACSVTRTDLHSLQTMSVALWSFL